MEAASSDSEDDEPAPAPNALLQKLLAGGSHGAADDDDDSDDDDDASALVTHPASKQKTAPSAAAALPASGDADERADVAGLLPSAGDVLFDGGGPKPDFLRVQGPEFDASANFKPPPVTHAELTGMCGEGGYHGARPSGASEGYEAPAQRYHPEETFGRSNDQVRLRGSVCHETEAERGRRVVYGAHSMLKADPWSNCNPNKPFISHASGKKRPAGEY